MSDFMKWLHACYIKPCVDSAPKGDYEFWIALLRNGLTSDGQEALEKTLECTAIYAFLLRPRTGEGLSALTPR